MRIEVLGRGDRAWRRYECLILGSSAQLARDEKGRDFYCARAGCFRKYLFSFIFSKGPMPKKVMRGG